MLFDFHVHVTDEKTGVAESVQVFRSMCRRNGLAGLCIHAAEYSSRGDHRDCNEKALAIARADPSWYAFAGLHHDHPLDFVEQTKDYMARGFRGIKLMEGKPSYYRHYGYGLDHPRFAPFFAYAEDHAIPLLIHNNDPLLHWDKTRISPSAMAKGWYYDESLPSQEHFFRVLEDILCRHPNLNAAIAHMGFYSDNIPRAERLMEQCPNLFMDMTPALIIYDELSRTPEQTKAFLQKYHRRLLYGTDGSNHPDESVVATNLQKSRILKAFYTGTEPYAEGSHSVRGMDLDQEVLEDIFCRNALRFLGETI